MVFIGLPMDVSADPTTIYVDDVPGSGEGNPPEDYTSIQSAIDAASAGDTIFIWGGTYNEELVVTKTLALEGESSQATLLRPSGSGWSPRGIYAYGASGITIENLNIQEFSYGIQLSQAGYSTVTNNIISNNSYYGIYSSYCPFSSIGSNTVSDNSWGGIDLSMCNSNTLTDNTVKNSRDGISLRGSSATELSGNTAEDNVNGILLTTSTSCIMRDNAMVDNEFNFYINSYSIADYTHDIDPSNTVDGKPIY